MPFLASQWHTQPDLYSQLLTEASWDTTSFADLCEGLSVEPCALQYKRCVTQNLRLLLQQSYELSVYCRYPTN